MQRTINFVFSFAFTVGEIIRHLVSLFCRINMRKQTSWLLAIYIRQFRVGEKSFRTSFTIKMIENQFDLESRKTFFNDHKKSNGMEWRGKVPWKGFEKDPLMEKNLEGKIDKEEWRKSTALNGFEWNVHRSKVWRKVIRLRGRKDDYKLSPFIS